MEHFYHKGQVASHYVPKSDTIVFADQLIYSGQTLILFSSIYIVGPSENERKNSVDKIAEILNVIESRLEVQPGYILFTPARSAEGQINRPSMLLQIPN